MGLFSRKTADSSPEAQEYRAAKKALADDPLNSGRLGYQSADSPAGRVNAAAQQRVNDAEKNLRRRG
ncbi:hypothetical protein NLX86_18890 [Streptomyces sp. A3M-1-3]|uniref:hypothetical protein n=1 Tax=Streptomyces sp. A3M-1-3 TaxID=2962044 RepID=UPI0020B6C64A|nr:hypothetical protein [Streptomyces sp. A3M-1-3]MCP3820085.1 hypothetical protein [Streptomyces sp. A3M-1-3]